MICTSTPRAAVMHSKSTYCAPGTKYGVKIVSDFFACIAAAKKRSLDP